jgi:type II secretory pathway pseudopilin PulG
MRAAAYTLIEVVIAFAIFMSLLAAVLQSLVSTTSFVNSSTLQDDVQLGARSVSRALTSDIAMSGWYFPASEDQDGDGTLDTGEDVNGDGALGDVSYNVVGTTPAADRALRYYPFVNVATSALAGTAFSTRRYPGAGGGGGFQETADLAPSVDLMGRNDLTALSPWPALSAGEIVDRARTMGVLIDPDLATELASPSADLIYLRAATGDYADDPALVDAALREDMVFFPGYTIDATGTATAIRGATAQAWNTPDNHANLPFVGTRQTVLFPSEYVPDGSGGYVHRNAQSGAATTEPYGVRAWGARLDDSASGPKLSIQWEAIAADRVDLDPNTGADDPTPPDDLREYVYALLPSPLGMGRLVRAHSVLKTGSPEVGVEVGDWISDPTRNRGWVINQVISDDVARIQWWTRRHDRSLQPNQVRARLILARVARQADGGQRQVFWREVTSVMAMWARSEYQDTKDAQTLIDVTTQTTDGTNIRLDY